MNIAFAHETLDSHILENPWDWPPSVRQVHFWGEVVVGAAIAIIFILFAARKFGKK